MRKSARDYSQRRKTFGLELCHTRACLGVQVMKLLKGRSQKEAAKLLGVKQPEVYALMRAKFSRFSQERLIGFLNKLDRKVTIQISRRRGKELYQQVTLAPQCDDSSTARRGWYTRSIPLGTQAQMCSGKDRAAPSSRSPVSSCLHLRSN
jgi:predicted XRE-type DNA-binding protein